MEEFFPKHRITTFLYIKIYAYKNILVYVYVYFYQLSSSSIVLCIPLCILFLNKISICISITTCITAVATGEYWRVDKGNLIWRGIAPGPVRPITDRPTFPAGQNRLLMIVLSRADVRLNGVDLTSISFCQLKAEPPAYHVTRDNCSIFRCFCIALFC